MKVSSWSYFICSWGYFICFVCAEYITCVNAVEPVDLPGKRSHTPLDPK